MRFPSFTPFVQLSCLMTVLSPLCSAQEQRDLPQFEVVVIRPALNTRTFQINETTFTAPARWQPCEYSRDRVRCQLPLWAFVREAFQLREFEITVPAWMKENYFELNATMPLDTPREAARQMLKQAILSSFHMQYHTAQKMTPVFALVATADGPHLTDHDPEKPQSRMMDTPMGKTSTTMVAVPGHYFIAAATLDIFALAVGNLAGLDRPVVNETGLTGRYTIELTWKSSANDEDITHIVDPGILNAMEQQIGLRLEKKTEMRTYLSVDSADKEPSAP